MHFSESKNSYSFLEYSQYLNAYAAGNPATVTAKKTIIGVWVCVSATEGKCRNKPQTSKNVMTRHIKLIYFFPEMWYLANLLP